jgi:PAS domain S-box-containing protein
MSNEKHRLLDPAAKPFPIWQLVAVVVAVVLCAGVAASLVLGARLSDGTQAGSVTAAARAWQGLAEAPLLALMGCLMILAGLSLWIVNRYERRLQLFAESRARNRAIVDNMIDGAIHIDAYGRIAGMNAAAADIFGYRAAELKGQPVVLLFALPLREQLEAEMLQSPALGLPPKLIGKHRVEGRRSDGSAFPLSLAVSEVHVGGYLVYTAVARDLSAPPPAGLEIGTSRPRRASTADRLEPA